MSITFKVKNIGYHGNTYEAGEVAVKESEGHIELTQLKKSFLSSKTMPIGQFNYDATTRIEISGLTLKIGETSFDLESQNNLDLIREIVARPYRAERERKEKIVSASSTAIQAYLLERAKVIEKLRMLKSNPRETLLSSLDGVNVVEDPLTQLYGQLRGSLSSAHSEMLKGIEPLKTVIGEEQMRKVHAGIYAMGSIQTALLNGGDITKPLSLLGKAASRNLIADNYLGSSQQDLASKLLEDSALMDTDALLGVKMI